MDGCEKGEIPRPATPVPTYLPGYAEYAAFIAVDPDLQIYRRFDRITARNILYLQSEMAALEKWFDEYDNERFRVGDAGTEEQRNTISSLNQDWARFAAAADAGKTAEAPSEDARREVDKMRKIKELRVITAAYQDALLRQNACMALAAPGKTTHKKLQEFLELRQPLMDLRDCCRTRYRQSLVAVRPQTDSDRLSRVLRDNIGSWSAWFHKKEYRYPESWGPIYKFQEDDVERFSAFISVFMAVTLLVVSVIALYFVQAKAAKLGLMAGFVSLFGLSVGLLSSCKRSELFAATATYAAVLVVFISGDITA